jgi:predicted alpha/beta hydrolase family esterase
MHVRRDAVRLLVIPGLGDSGPAHWQTWLQARRRHSVRVRQHDWQAPDLPRWSARIGETLARERAGAWVAVAHSVGCLALARHLAGRAPPRDAGAAGFGPLPLAGHLVQRMIGRAEAAKRLSRAHVSELGFAV